MKEKCVFAVGLTRELAFVAHRRYDEDQKKDDIGYVMVTSVGQYITKQKTFRQLVFEATTREDLVRLINQDSEAKKNSGTNLWARTGELVLQEGGKHPCIPSNFEVELSVGRLSTRKKTSNSIRTMMRRAFELH